MLSDMTMTFLLFFSEFNQFETGRNTNKNWSLSNALGVRYFHIMVLHTLMLPETDISEFGAVFRVYFKAFSFSWMVFCSYIYIQCGCKFYLSILRTWTYINIANCTFNTLFSLKLLSFVWFNEREGRGEILMKGREIF
jgi:hypothetical protein